MTTTKDFFHIISEFTKMLTQAHSENEKQQRMQLRRSSSSFLSSSLSSSSRSRANSVSCDFPPSFLTDLSVIAE